MTEETMKTGDSECWAPSKATREERDRYIKNYKSVKRWLEGFSANSVRGTDRVFARYLATLINFCRFMGENPDSIVKRRLEDLQSADIDIRERYERAVQRFYTKCFKNRKKFSGGVSCVSALKSFFFHNGAPLNVKSPRKVIMKPRQIITMDEIRKLYMAADARERVMLKIQIHGFRPETLLKMRYGLVSEAIESQKYPAVIPFSSMELKGAYAPFYLFLDEEACEDIVRYMEIRRRGTSKIPPEKINDSSPLIRAKNCNKPLEYGGYRKMLKKLVWVAGLDKNLTPYAFRRFFQTTAEASGIPLNWVDYLMCHCPRGADASSYSQPSLEQLKTAFLKVEPFLRIKQTSLESEGSAKKDLLRSFATFAGVDLEETIKNKKLKSIEDMNENEIGALFDEFRNALLRKRLIIKELKCEEESDASHETVTQKNNKKFHVMIAKSKPELIEKLEDGWELIRELEGGDYLLRKKNTGH